MISTVYGSFMRVFPVIRGLQRLDPGRGANLGHWTRGIGGPPMRRSLGTAPAFREIECEPDNHYATHVAATEQQVTLYSVRVAHCCVPVGHS